MTPTVNIFSLDDDPDVLEAVKKILHKGEIQDYRLFTDHGKFFSELTADIHLCLLDHYMPEMSGIEVLKKIKAISKDSFVIVLSGQTKYKVVIDYLNECADRYVDKNDRDYLQKLEKFLQVGLQAAYKRLEEIEILKERRKEIANRRKLYEPYGNNELDKPSY